MSSTCILLTLNFSIHSNNMSLLLCRLKEGSALWKLRKHNTEDVANGQQSQLFARNLTMCIFS